MLSEGYRGSDLLINAWRINESLPEYMVKATIDRWGDLADKSITVLGYAFKKDTDDTRDSLVPKLIRSLIRHGPPQLTISDPYTPKRTVDLPLNSRFTADAMEAVEGADIVFIATNHGRYEDERNELLRKLHAQCPRHQ
jgi:UDP-N-acetyl-D-mannosaminuronate dehydrogenase